MPELITVSAAVAVLSMLITVSALFEPVRATLPTFNGLFYCPICLGFWIAIPYSTSFNEYLLIVALSNVWMLVIAKLYLAIEDLNYGSEEAPSDHGGAD